MTKHYLLMVILTTPTEQWHKLAQTSPHLQDAGSRTDTPMVAIRMMSGHV